MNKQTPFRLLVRLFYERFLENDSESPESGFTPNLYQLLGFLAAPAVIVTVFLMPDMIYLTVRKPGPDVAMALVIFRLFFPAYSFAAIVFTTVFEWDMLFPDRRDFLVIGTFPLRVRDIFLAKFKALGLFLLMPIAVVNLGPTIMVPLVSFDIPQVHGNGLLLVFCAQLASTLGASAFGFFTVAAFQGLLINILSPRLFRRVSPWIQVFGMAYAIASIVLYPVYSMLLSRMVWLHPNWLWLFPPFWFTGIYDLLLTGGVPKFAELGKFGLVAIGIVAMLFYCLWLAGFQRHYRRTLESEDTTARRPRNPILARWFFKSRQANPEELAIFEFTGRMLSRSAKHRLFLAAYWSVGLSIGALFTIAIRRGEPALSQDGLRSLPFLIEFFVVSGMRAGFQFPVDLQANWLFQITERRWSQIARRAGRTRVLVSGLAPIVLLFIPYSLWLRGVRAAIFDAIFQLMTGALLTELLFWRFDKVPFTCPYFQGSTNLFLLAVVYLYGFTTYSFQLSDLQISLERNELRAAISLGIGGAALAFAWFRRSSASRVRFEGGEPVIRTLDLT